ncbi:type II secretion system protein GspL [Fulvimonas sp. R45]|jgi:general secretion pathway protein L|uniref:PilN domain-containing protein n=1 Tax=Fulvimonas sp. R45 TaxID=3045937 RepID=UPI0026601815|nr:type II secretion system protein GspL [Fulvimonas sp. R45]MDO1528948.1 type II secretion system protein GspL [Fulvimonas sp. R45]
MNSASQSLRPQLERLQRAWRGSPLPGFLAWWGGELRALLPARWRGLFGGGAEWRLLQHADGRWTLRQPGVAAPLARWNDSLDAAAQQAALAAATAGTAPQDLRLALCLPPQQVLRRRLSLPLAARDNLRQVGAFEMDRQTPFRAEQVHYAVRELPGVAPAGRFNAELVAVPRGQLDAQLQRLREAGIAVDAADLADGDGRLGTNLLPPEQARVRRDPRRRLNLALAGAAALLLVLCLGQWLRNREDALAAMQAQVDGMHAQARQVALLRQQLLDNAGAAGFLAQRKAGTVGVLDLLQDLTSHLPDDTWLERFTVDGQGHVGFQGQSAKAAQLVDALQGSRLLADPSFQGVIQRDPNTGKERFYMVAQVRAPAAAKPAPEASR